MIADTNSNYYQKGLELAEAGKHQQALASIQKHLRLFPDDAEALNDAGAILHCLGRFYEAINHFVKARALSPGNPQLTWNLAESYLAAGIPAEAVGLFDQMAKLGILNPDIMNRAAKIFLDQDNKADAMEVMLRSLQAWPNQGQILTPMVEVIRSKRPKTTFFCGLKGDVKFLTDIYEFIGQRYPVQFFEGRTVEQLQEAMKSSPIAWFEWCTEMVVQASKLPKVCKTIVRLHRFEAYTDWPSQVAWENIDVLILVGNSFVKKALLEQVPDLESRTQVVTISNGINPDKFSFMERPRGKNIACVGYLNLRKNPMFLLQCMQKLHYTDTRYKLYFAGSFQDPALEQYLRHMVQVMGLEDVVFFDGWQADVNSWLQDKHYIVSASIGESQGMGILEGMACGLKPVIHNFPGAIEIFPAEFMFNISEQFCERIVSGSYEPQKYRKFVEQTYSLKTQLQKIDNILLELEAEINSAASQPVENVQSSGQFTIPTFETNWVK